MPLQPNTEEYWQANEDASTLIRAESIKADAKRLAGATEVLQKQEQARKDALKAANRATKK